MTTTPDIEAVLRELSAELYYAGLLNAPETHVTSLHRRSRATITDLQARVTEAEGERDAARALLKTTLEDYADLTNAARETNVQLVASQAEVAQARRDEQYWRREYDDYRAGLDAHKSAVGEAWARKERANYACSPEACVSWVMSPLSILRAPAEPAKQGEGDALDVAFVDACREANQAGYQQTHEQYAADLRKALAARGLSVKGEG